MPAAQGYIGRNPADSSTVIARQSFSPTGIQTDFTFAAGYDVGHVDLYLNGVRLVEGQDFTATNGSTVGLTTNAVNGDVLELVAFKAFNATNVTTAGGDFTVGNNLTVSGTSEFTGAITATGGVVGNVTGNASGTAGGLTGTPDITVRHLKATGISTVSDTTQTTSITSGAFIVSGGVGIAKSLFVGGDMNIAGTLTYEDVTNVETSGITTTGGLVVTGLGATFGSGVGIADSIYHIDDSNTAIRFPAADTFTVTTAGSERVRVDSSGNFGINETAPAADLVVKQSGNTFTTASQTVALFQRSSTTGHSAKIAIVAGNAATSDIHFGDTDDEDIGAIQYTHTDNSLRFTTNTSERLRIDSSGQVILNNSASSGDATVLRLTGGTSGSSVIEMGDTADTDIGQIAYYHGTTNAMAFRVNASEALRIDSSGRILKGPATARGNFANNASGAELDFQIEGTSFAASSLSLVRNSNDANDCSLVIGKTRATSVGGNTVVQAGDDLGDITFAGADGTSLQHGANIVAEVQSGVGNDDLPTDLIFKTNGGTTSTTERLRITSGGQHNFKYVNNQAPRTYANGSHEGLMVSIDRDDNSNFLGTIDFAAGRASDGSNGGTQFRFWTQPRSTGAAAERLRITSAGLVRVPDNGKFTAGAGDDLEIYHDGTDNFIKSNAALKIQAAGSNSFTVHVSARTDKETIKCYNNTNAPYVELFYDNSKKFETTSTGITVTGIIVDRLGGDIRRAIQATKTSAYTLVEEDTGRHIYISTGGVTVPNGIFNAGAMVTIVNNSGSNQTITQGSSMTMYNTADATTGNRTLAGRGVCTILFASGSQSYISGAGLS